MQQRRNERQTIGWAQSQGSVAIDDTCKGAARDGMLAAKFVGSWFLDARWTVLSAIMV